MAITNISTDQGIDPRIVRVVTTDTFTAITTTGYLTTQISNIKAIQNGLFQWLPTDSVYIFYNGGQGFFTHNEADQRFDEAIDQAGIIVAQQVFTSPGTYIPTPSMNFCFIEVYGGGGAGGGTQFSTVLGVGSAAGGGGAGAYSIGLFTASQIGSSQLVGVGLGGTGRTGAPGDPGGLSFFGDLLTAFGGNGGNFMSSNINNFGSTNGGGGGPQGEGGSFNGRGASGFASLVVGNVFAISGAGASTNLGGGGASVIASSSSETGIAARPSTGSGGSGAALQNIDFSASAGGNGSAGIVIITEFL